MNAKTISIKVTEEQADALAALAKRMGYRDARELSIDTKETELMMSALGALQRALQAEGHAPR